MVLSSLQKPFLYSTSQLRSPALLSTVDVSSQLLVEELWARGSHACLYYEQ